MKTSPFKIFFSMEIVITGSFGNSTFAYSALGLVFPDSFHEAADDYFFGRLSFVSLSNIIWSGFSHLLPSHATCGEDEANETKREFPLSPIPSRLTTTLCTLQTVSAEYTDWPLKLD